MNVSTSSALYCHSRNPTPITTTSRAILSAPATTGSWIEPIAYRLGDTGLNILNRVFGLLLAAIAVEVTANGLRQLFPVLAGG
jgi:small neutral amino acid transporter SnatA (MarC family)